MNALRRLLCAAFLAGLAGGAAAGELLTFPIVIKDGRIIPARLEVPAGQKIKLTIRNEGPGPCEFENLDLRVEKVLAPGASSFVVIHPLKPGSYKFFDEFHPSTSEMIVIAK
ncbi:MAG: cupredoxin domain-containing protein [Rhodocyclales bacterium]|nr:cupredoxin domain-containing protein [Rhodocyclales bacterium]